MDVKDFGKEKRRMDCVSFDIEGMDMDQIEIGGST